MKIKPLSNSLEKNKSISINTKMNTKSLLKINTILWFNKLRLNKQAKS